MRKCTWLLLVLSAGVCHGVGAAAVVRSMLAAHHCFCTIC